MTHSTLSPWRSLVQAAVSQFHPKMLALLVLPWLASLALWGLIAWFAWSPLTRFVSNGLLADSGWLFWLSTKLGWAEGSQWLAGVFAFVLIVPLMFVTAMLITTIFAMPAVIRHLCASTYSDVARDGSLSLAASGSNAIVSLAIFIPGYLLTVPLWFIPVVGLLVPVMWWGWLNARVMRFDSLAEHATSDEIKHMIKKHARSYFLLGAAVSALNYIPPLFLLTPIFGALAFAHFSLNLLRKSRS